MEFSKLSRWIGRAGLAAALTGCVITGGDDALTTVADSGPMMTTQNATTDATGEPTTSTGSTGTPGSSGGDTSAESTGAVTCDPPCMEGQICVEGSCFDDGSDESSGDPPAECGLGVMLNFPNPACGPCLEASCCDVLQACFGDETVMMETECLGLNNCVVMSCIDAATLPELEACVDMNCAETAGSLADWLAYQNCVGMNCAADCA